MPTSSANSIRERRRRRDAAGIHAGGRRLLHDLEAEPPAHRHQGRVKREHFVPQRVPDHLVDRVVAADVLAQRLQFHARQGVVACRFCGRRFCAGRSIELNRWTERTARRHDPLVAAKTSCARRIIGASSRIAPGATVTRETIGAIRRWVASILVLPHTPQLDEIVKLRLRRSRRFAAGTLRMTSTALGSGAPLGPHSRRISPRSAAIRQALGEQKPGDEFLVVARRAHREREAPSAKPDFEWLLDREAFVFGIETPVAEFARRMMPDALGRRGALDALRDPICIVRHLNAADRLIRPPWRKPRLRGCGPRRARSR